MDQVLAGLAYGAIVGVLIWLVRKGFAAAFKGRGEDR